MKRSVISVITLVFLITLVGTVGAVCTEPEALFGCDKVTGHPGESFQFTNLSTGCNLTYAWVFGDDSEISTDPSPSHVYTDVGLYDVTLTARDSFNNNFDDNAQLEYIEITADDTPLNTSVGGILDSLPPLFGSLLSLVIAAIPILVILAIVTFILGILGAVVGKIKP